MLQKKKKHFIAENNILTKILFIKNFQLDKFIGYQGIRSAQHRSLVILLALPFSGFTDCQHWATLVTILATLVRLSFRSGTHQNRTPSHVSICLQGCQTTHSQRKKSRSSTKSEGMAPGESGWRKCQGLCENKAKKSFLNAA